MVSPKDSRINPLNLTFDLRSDIVKGSSSNLREKSGKRPTETGKFLGANKVSIANFSGDGRGIKTSKLK